MRRKIEETAQNNQELNRFEAGFDYITTEEKQIFIKTLDPYMRNAFNEIDVIINDESHLNKENITKLLTKYNYLGDEEIIWNFVFNFLHALSFFKKHKNYNVFLKYTIQSIEDIGYEKVNINHLIIVYLNDLLEYIEPRHAKTLIEIFAVGKIRLNDAKALRSLRKIFLKNTGYDFNEIKDIVSTFLPHIDFYKDIETIELVIEHGGFYIFELIIPHIENFPDIEDLFNKKFIRNILCDTYIITEFYACLSRALIDEIIEKIDLYSYLDIAIEYEVHQMTRLDFIQKFIGKEKQINKQLLNKLFIENHGIHKCIQIIPDTSLKILLENAHDYKIKVNNYPEETRLKLKILKIADLLAKLQLFDKIEICSELQINNLSDMFAMYPYLSAYLIRNNYINQPKEKIISSLYPIHWQSRIIIIKSILDAGIEDPEKLLDKMLRAHALSGEPPVSNVFAVQLAEIISEHLENSDRKVKLSPFKLKQFTTLTREQKAKYNLFEQFIRIGFSEQEKEKFIENITSLYIIPNELTNIFLNEKQSQIYRKNKDLQFNLAKEAALMDFSFMFFRGNIPWSRITSGPDNFDIEYFIQQLSPATIQEIRNIFKDYEHKQLSIGEQLKILESKTSPDIDTIFKDATEEEFVIEIGQKPSLIFYIRFYGDIDVWQGSDLIQSGFMIKDTVKVMKKFDRFFDKLFVVTRFDPESKFAKTNPFAGKPVWIAKDLTQEIQDIEWISNNIKFIPADKFKIYSCRPDSHFIQLTHGNNIDTKPGIVGSIIPDYYYANVSKHIDNKTVCDVLWPGEEQGYNIRLASLVKNKDISWTRTEYLNSLKKFMRKLAKLYKI